MAAVIFPQAIIGTTVESGDKLYFYEVGTTTDLSVYTDFDLTTPHAQPVVANSSGLFAEIYLDATANDPKVVLTDSDDVEKWTLTRYPIEDITTLSNDLDTAESEIDTLQGNDATQDADIDTLQTESADYETRISALEGADSGVPANLLSRLPCAYAFFVGQTNPSFAQSFGFSGVSKNATGQFDLTFSTARDDANYVVIATAGPQSASSPLECLVTNKSTTGFRVETWYTTGGSTRALQDRDVNVVVFDSNNDA